MKTGKFRTWFPHLLVYMAELNLFGRNNKDFQSFALPAELPHLIRKGAKIAIFPKLQLCKTVQFDAFPHLISAPCRPRPPTPIN